MQASHRPFRACSQSILRISISCCMLLPVCMIIVCAFLQSDPTHLMRLPLGLSAFRAVLDPLTIALTAQAMLNGFIITVLCLAISYPCALALCELPRRIQNMALTLLVVPFWTSTLVRTYAMLTLVKSSGWLSHTLMAWHITKQPLQIAFTPTATTLGLVYDLLPLMLIPLYLKLRALDPRLLEAARDLGAGPWSRFWRIKLPLTAKTAMVACLLIWLPAISLFYVPEVLGGAKSLMLGNLISDAFTTGHWPLGSALCLLLMLPLMGMLVGLQREPEVLAS